MHVDIPLQAYFRINTENMGQFERTLIILDEGGYVHYVEGWTAPIYKSDSLHSAVVDIIVKPGGRCRYTVIQNWSNNVYNLVDTISRSDTYPYVDICEDDVTMGHEATVSKVSENQLFYLMSRGLTRTRRWRWWRGFVEPIAKELPMEYALVLNRLI